jgi:endoglucanase
VHEITMAAPDIVCVEIRDPPISKGVLETLGSPDAGAYNAWLARGGSYAIVVGPQKLHRRFQDERATVYLDRVAADIASDYGSIGGRSVTNVYRKTMPYDEGFGRYTAGAFTVKATSSKHFLYLKLSGALAPGNHTVRFPIRTGLASHSFQYDDKSTRASSIRATQHGHRPGDVNKLAYLAQWVPGAPNEGAINFVSAYGLTTFHIVDTNGRVHFTGPIVQRIGPTDVERADGNGSRIRYATSRPPMVATNATQTNPVVITSSGHGLIDGDTIRLKGFTHFTGLARNPRLVGMTQLDGGQYTVVNATADTFELLDVDGRAYGAFAGSGLIYPTHSANRAGTYVYGLDYSSWRPSKPGVFRVYVPNLGVSDPFTIDDAIWFQSAKCSAKGEYHHRSGCEIDGRFGYVRPVAFKSGVDRTIYKSTMPYAFTAYGGSRGGLNVAMGCRAPWITATEATAWGGWMDAGDWDSRIAATTGSTFMLLDIYEQLPIGAREVDFGLPKSSDVLDPKTYAGTNGLSDLIHSAIWNLDFYRRTQEPNGAISGGMNFAESTNAGEPSYLFRGDVTTYYPDHIATFSYAGLAAKLSRILSALGHGLLAQTYRDSALLAWKWADSIYLNAAVRDAHYNVVRSNAGWDKAAYDAAIASVQSAAALPRRFAASCLYRLTGSTVYGDIVKSAWPFDLFGLAGLTAWEYSQSNRPSDDPSVKSGIRIAIVNRARQHILSYSESRVAYRNLNYSGLPMNWGQGGPNMADTGPSCIFAHLISRDPRFLAALQANMGHIQGANQNGLCLTTGLGRRNTKGVLHIDGRATAQEVPAGITIYGWTQQNFVHAVNFGISSLVYIIEPEADLILSADFEPNRTISPNYRAAFPNYEALWENSLCIEQMEYTIQQTIIPALYVSTYLHGYDGNRATKYQ